jgi:hypothetical protein
MLPEAQRTDWQPSICREQYTQPNRRQLDSKDDYSAMTDVRHEFLLTPQLADSISMLLPSGGKIVLLLKSAGKLPWVLEKGRQPCAPTKRLIDCRQTRSQERRYHATVRVLLWWQLWQMAAML